MITDIHCHLVPEAYLRHVEAERAFRVRCAWHADGTAQLDVGEKAYRFSRDFVDPARHIARMDRLGIDRSVVSLATPLVNYSATGPAGLHAARLFNDELAKVVSAYPTRFLGWAFLPMQDPEAAAAELHRAVRDLGLRGGHLGSNVNGRYLDAPQYDPIFRAATDLDVPLFIHPTNPPGQDRLRDYELEVVGGYLFDSTLNIFHMIFGGLLDRYPTLTLCCPHVGGYALLLRNRMQREVGTNPLIAQRIARPVGDYLRRLYYDTICFEGNYLDYAVKTVGADRFVLGSDFPFLLGEPDPVAFVRGVYPHGDMGTRILGENAARMLKL